MTIIVLYYMCKQTKEHIRKELQKLKELKERIRVKLSARELMKMKGFMKLGLTEKAAQKLLDEMREYVQVVLKQLNRLNALDVTNKIKE